MPELNVVDAIKQTNDSFALYLRRGEARAIAGLYTHDAVLLPPGSDFVEGRNNIETFWRSVMDAGISSVQLETVELHDFGGMAIEIGTYKLYAGNAMVDSGKYVVVWRQEDGGWKFYRDAWNTSAAVRRANAA